MDILAFDLTALLADVQNIFKVAIGLGLVIFFHEFGHFAVAKWCGVFVERFSIGFGPILWSFKRGETEYALSAVPFGGYVKMLGQDDLDPSQLTSEEIARDPRAYSNKGVFQRMAIISAGVIMNIITAMLFYAIAFRSGVDTVPSKVGSLQIGKPAWQKGLQPGDIITRINGRDTLSFADIMRGTALSTGQIKVEGTRIDGTKYVVDIEPDRAGKRRVIGVSWGELYTLKVGELGLGSATNRTSAIPNTPAASLKDGFQNDDEIIEVGGEKVTSYAQMAEFLARRRSESLDFVVKRGTQAVTISVPGQKFLDLGIWMDIEKVAAIQEGSPAANAKLLVGDKITKINGDDVGTKINPLFLADTFESLAGQEVEVQVKRIVVGSPELQQFTLKLTPTSAAAWTEQPNIPGTPLSIPSIGVAYHLTSNVLKVVPGGAAAKSGVPELTTLKSMTIETEDSSYKFNNSGQTTLTIEFTDAKNVALNNMAHALWILQVVPKPTVTLEFTDGKTKAIKLTPEPSSNEYYVPSRGIILQHEKLVLLADSWPEAVTMGVTYTQNTTIDIYMTLRSLFSGDLSVKNLSGPVDIAKQAFEVSQEGISKLLLFLGFLSVNLAVLNFLPIPVLDGGHMVFLIWEGVTRRRPSRRVLEYATICGFVFVVGLMIFVIGLDLFVDKTKV